MVWKLNGTMTLRSVDYAGSFVYFDGTPNVVRVWPSGFCGYRHYVYNGVYARGDGVATRDADHRAGYYDFTAARVGNSWFLSNDTLINQGTINADTSGKTITISAANWTNLGLLKAETVVS